MSKVIDGVPESISRDDFTRLIESVGFDAKYLLSLTFESGGIRARVIEPDRAGRMIVGPPTSDDDEFSVASHEIHIPIVDVDA